jgi:general secretion pathway protein G
MANTFGRKYSGFTQFEFAISASVLALLAAVLLSRLFFYQEQAEMVAVKQLVATMRTALQVRASDVASRTGEGGLRRLLEENPLDLLEHKPDNYLGEYYSPDLEKIPSGNWVFDRRDKCLIYLLRSHKSFSSNASNLLKFKVEFAQLRAQAAAYKKRPGEVSRAVVLDQVNDQASAVLDQ